MIFAPMILFDGLLWSLVKARKETECLVTKKIIAPGDSVYRPITNGSRRMYRIKASKAHEAENGDVEWLKKL